MTQSHAILQSIAFSSLSDQWERQKSFTFFRILFSKLFLYQINVSFTLVIKRSPGWESAGCGRSTSKSTCAVPTWSLTVFGDRPASSMSKFSASMSSDLGNGSFWVEIRDAEHVDRCSWKCTRVWSYRLTSDLRDVYFFLICFQWSLVGGLRGSTATSALVSALTCIGKSQRPGVRACHLTARKIWIVAFSFDARKSFIGFNRPSSFLLTGMFFFSGH